LEGGSKMFNRQPYASQPPELEEIRLTGPSVPSVSCCCPASPVVKAIMPSTASRRHSVDLWLCGHHYRASVAALAKAGARVENLTVLPADRPLTDRAGLPA
jgi:hypothetical protein